MDARRHFRAAEQALDWANTRDDEDRGDARDISFLLQAIACGQLAVAAALITATDPKTAPAPADAPAGTGQAPPT